MKIKKITFSVYSPQSLCSLIAVTLILIGTNGQASFELQGSGARIHAMGQAYVGLANTPDAIFVNCSGLAQLSHIACSLFYTKPFGLKELAYGSFAAVIPTSCGSFAAGITSFGNELYREQSLIISYDRSITQKFCYGFNFHYMKLHINDYGSDFSFKIDFGFLMKITLNWNWGFMATNLNRASFASAHDLLPQTVCSGFCFSPLDQLKLTIDLFKDSLFPLELRCGTEYILFNRMALRSGFSTEPAQFCGGIGFLFKHFGVDYAVITHTDLGLTHYFSIQLSFAN